MWLRLPDEKFDELIRIVEATSPDLAAQLRQSRDDLDNSSPEMQAYVQAAKDIAEEGDLEFDDDAVVSKPDGEDSGGAYVMGWKWISDDADEW